jgi:hypothetical protein
VQALWNYVAPSIKQANAIVDFVVTADRVLIIELNPFVCIPSSSFFELATLSIYSSYDYSSAIQAPVCFPGNPPPIVILSKMVHLKYVLCNHHYHPHIYHFLRRGRDGYVNNVTLIISLLCDVNVIDSRMEITNQITIAVKVAVVVVALANNRYYHQLVS